MCSFLKGADERLNQKPNLHLFLSFFPSFHVSLICTAGLTEGRAELWFSRSKIQMALSVSEAIGNCLERSDLSYCTALLAQHVRIAVCRAICLRVPALKDAVWLTQTGGDVALGALVGLRGVWLPSSAVAWSVLFAHPQLSQFARMV